MPALAKDPVTQPFTITVIVTPVVTAIDLSNDKVDAGPANSGVVVGALSVVTNPPGGTFAGNLALGGTNAALFALSSTTLPSNLLVGSSDLPAGDYSITVTATP